MAASSGQTLFSISSLLQSSPSKASPKAIGTPSPTFLHQLNLLLTNSTTTQSACKPREMAGPIIRHNSSIDALDSKLIEEVSPSTVVRRKSAEGALEVRFKKLGKEEEREDSSTSPCSASSRVLESCSSPEAIPAPNTQMKANQWYNYVAASMAAAAASQQQQQLQLSVQGGGSSLPGGMPIATGWDLGRMQPWLYPYANPATTGSMHHHHKSQHKRKGGQIRFTNEQTDALENTFDNHKYLSNNQRKKLAKSLVLSERQMGAVWKIRQFNKLSTKEAKRGECDKAIEKSNGKTKALLTHVNTHE